jgi:hypothetical protein
LIAGHRADDASLGRGVRSQGRRRNLACNTDSFLK